jgi:GH15 family glucan-1,4-alpha-glucosidase
MARPIVLSNGELHVGLNKFGLVHDFYYPYVGFENHSAGEQLRHKVGVYVDGQVSWLDEDEGWTFKFHYPHTALIGHTLARNERLGVILEFDDLVDAEMSAFIRNIHVVNLADQPREIKIYLHQAFAIGDSRSNTDTAQYLPDSNALLHYRGRRAFVIGGDQDKTPFDQFTIGLFGIEGREGSYRDAEDGFLSGNVVEHGRVDSVIGFTLNIEAQSSKRVHYWIAAGLSIREALYVHRQLSEDGIHKRVHRTADWWREWLAPALELTERIPVEQRTLFLQSVMLIKSQMDKRGAVIASTDSTMLNYSRDAYAYSWPRDGGFALWPLIRMGYTEEPLRFFEFCRRGMHPSGYLMHKYRADGALGSSWHPYVHGNETAPPIQEDETAIVIFMFSQYYQVQKDSGLLRDFYASMVVPMANFLVDFTDPHTGLPKPSYDLWEEYFMVTTYSTAVTYAGLLAAAELATLNGDHEHAVKWRTAADDLHVAAQKYLYNKERKVFYKGIFTDNGRFDVDETIDTSAIFGSYLFGLFDTDSEELQASVETTKQVFNVTPTAPGLPRYENDPYRRTSDKVTGNWWYISTLWHAQYLIDQGRKDEVDQILHWVTSHAPSTGVLGEQVDPTIDQQVAPAPLTWSHAEFVSTMLDYIDRG